MYSVNLDIALRLPSPDVEALIQGRSIAILPRTFLDNGKIFALFPADISPNTLPLEQSYQPHFLSIARQIINNLSSEKVIIKAWAKCVKCDIFQDAEALESLAKLTIWTTEGLQAILSQRPYLFLAFLRVYLLPSPIEMPVSQGRFVALPKTITVSDNLPVLTDNTFSQRCYQLENRLPPKYPELVNLQAALAEISINNPLARDISILLGWGDNLTNIVTNPDLVWINKIAEIGNSSDGNEFEKLVRKSLIYLGFANSNKDITISLDPESTGGAGGLDFYCETPYQVVGECKATKTEKVSDGTPAQLVKLGNKHLQDKYNNCIKIIMAAGSLTEHAELTAIGNKMNVIRPETLQRLIELKAKHQGSIDLLELKTYLEGEPFGSEADGKINQYIDRVWEKIKLRSHLVNLIKNTNKSIGIEYLSGVYDASNPPQPLTTQQMQEILIELSSPLTGYLGRENDKFYFLRDLAVD